MPTRTGERGLTARLAEFVVATGWEDIPPAVRHQAKRSLLNFLATAIGSAREPAIDGALAALAPFAGPAQAAVFGRPERLDVRSAAFANAVAGNLFDFDDTHLPTVIHPSAPVIPPAFALSEWRGMSGRDLLTAFLLGGEVECRIGNAVSPGHYARGWHITASCGVFGSAAAAARLLGLGAAPAGHALGIAASLSSGNVENLTTGAKNAGVGSAAQNGILAALMAAQGFAAAPAALEGPLGWARASASALDATQITDGLGEHWEIGRNTYKPYPAGIVMHPVIDACFELRRAGIGADDIVSVTVRGHPLLLERGMRAVANERDARVSIHHCVAAVFLFGAAGLDAFSPEAAIRPDVVAFRRRIGAEIDDTMPVGMARVEVRTTTGETATATVAEALGSEGKPMADGQIEDKFRSLTARNPDFAEADRLIAAIWDLDRAPTVAEIARLVATGAPG